MQYSIKSITKNSLVANSLSLMLAAGATAGFGFVFWIIIAHTFNTASVGLATTVLSMSGLIALLGLAGFDTTFIRFLAKSKKRNDQINSGLLGAAGTTAILAILFCVLIPWLSPKLSIIDKNPWFVLAFIVFTIFSCWNTLTNAALIAYRRASFVLVINIIFSALKMCLPFLVHSGGPMTIFVIVGIAQIVNVALSIAALVKFYDYTPSLKIHFDVIKKTIRFSSTVYVGNVLNLLPDSALPLIVIDKLGASSAAYFYIAFTIANLLYTIAFSTTQALLAEASFYEADFKAHILKGLRVISALLIPAIVLIFVLCPFILRIFGRNYENGSTELLRIMSVSGLAVMFYAILGTTFKLTHNLKAILATTSTNAIAIIVLSLLLAPRWGLDGVGWAWMIGSFASVFVGFIFFILRWRSNIQRIQSKELI